MPRSGPSKRMSDFSGPTRASPTSCSASSATSSCSSSALPKCLSFDNAHSSALSHRFGAKVPPTLKNSSSICLSTPTLPLNIAFWALSKTFPPSARRFTAQRTQIIRRKRIAMFGSRKVPPRVREMRENKLIINKIMGGVQKFIRDIKPIKRAIAIGLIDHFRPPFVQRWALFRPLRTLRSL